MGFPLSLSAPSRAGDSAFDGESDTVRDHVVRTCSRCSRPLSVGERMFYFLEAVNTPALCRICVLDQEREITSPENSSSTRATPELAGRTAPSESSTLPPPARAARRTPSSVPEEIHEHAATGREVLSAREPLPLSGARHLRRAASHYVAEGRLEEAIECIRELAAELAVAERPVSAHSPEVRPTSESIYRTGPAERRGLEPVSPRPAPRRAGEPSHPRETAEILD